jgi:hypothetical protein
MKLYYSILVLLLFSFTSFTQVVTKPQVKTYSNYPRPAIQPVNKIQGVILLECNLDAVVYINGESVGTIVANTPKKFMSVIGDNIVEVISSVNVNGSVVNYRDKQTLFVQLNIQKVHVVDLLKKKEEDEKKLIDLKLAKEKLEDSLMQVARKKAVEDSLAEVARKEAEEKRKLDELTAWNQVKDSFSTRVIENYIDENQNSAYIDKAHQILKRNYLLSSEELVKKNDVINLEFSFDKFRKRYPDDYENIDKLKPLLSDLYFNTATNLYKRKSWADSKKYFKKYSELNPQDLNNKYIVRKIARCERKEKQVGGVFTMFSFSTVNQDDIQYGLNIGGMSVKKSNFYMNINVNNDLFSELEGNTSSLMLDSDKPLSPKISIAMGGTRKILYPIWMYAGMGVGVNSVYIDDVKSSKWGLYPECGLLLRLGIFSFKYGVSYQDDIIYDYYRGTINSQFAVGFCFKIRN